ncbi:MAG: 23S rRNA (uracil(1939)-C(5))-methyltransferase RlmD [Clostridia bacterium]|nr:23S rRNA (uracil(1939)-C(5))-methyltransferase RlmD [Clostridia bacterium]
MPGTPLRKNQIVEMEVSGFGLDAEGVCRHGDAGMAVFVPGALPGERIRARIVKVEKRHAFARLEGIDRASADRAEPPCPVYRRCGGCAAQHMTYARTLEFKRIQVRDCLARIGGDALAGLQVPAVLGMDEPWHYRNKGSFPVSGQPGAPRIGFYAPRSHEVIDAPMGCMIQHPTANGLVAAVRAWMEAHRVAPYDEAAHAGALRHIVVRTARDGRAMVTLVSREPSLPATEELLEALRGAAPGLASVMLCHNPARTNVIFEGPVRALWGADAIEDTLCGLRFRVSPHSFFQVNPAQTEALYARALAFAALTGSETVVDAYCGAGAISLLLARGARRVIGIESLSAAVADARFNAERNGIENAEFVPDQAERALPELVAHGLAPQVVVVDPPRKGCDPALLAAIAQAAPRRVVYVSCNPATLARDASYLCKAGFRAVAVQPVDMFCWAGGVEAVMLLESCCSMK